MSRYLRQNALRGRASPFVGGACEDDGLPADQEAFYEHLGETDVIRFDPEIDQDEVFDDQFERRAHEMQRTPGQDKTMSLVPNRTGPWTGNNNLGIERAFSPDENNRQTILKLPEWGFPEVWTLVLGLTYNSDLYDPNGAQFSVTSDIEFGSGGCIQTVEVDWLQGMSIALPMNAVNVIASYNSDLNEGGIPISLPSDLRLRATIVRGTLEAANPTRSYLVSGAATATVPVPPFAKAVRIMPRELSALDRVADFYRVNRRATFMSADPSVFASAASVATLELCQFVQYLDNVELTAGCPVYVDVPEGARFLQLDGTAIASRLVQFRLGV